MIATKRKSVNGCLLSRVNFLLRKRKLFLLAREVLWGRMSTRKPDLQHLIQAEGTHHLKQLELCISLFSLLIQYIVCRILTIDWELLKSKVKKLNQGMLFNKSANFYII